MLVDIDRWEFADRIRNYDSCSLSFAACDALYNHIQGLIDDGVLDPEVYIGDWAVMACEYTLRGLSDEHDGPRFESWDEVSKRVADDFLDNCWSDVIVVDDVTAVLVAL